MNTQREDAAIIVGVDGSEPSVDALREAGALADSIGAPLEVVLVWDVPTESSYDRNVAFSREAEASAALSETVEKAFARGTPPALTTSLLRGGIARTLIQHSAEARMRVVGSRGHPGFMGLLLGSVNAACAEHASCPVLVVHRPRPVDAGASGS